MYNENVRRKPKKKKRIKGVKYYKNSTMNKKF